MGAVLHTLNIRLPADQLGYVVNHAEDRCIIVDASLIPLLAAIKDDLKTVETIIVVGEGDTSSLGETLSYERILGAEQAGFEWPDLDERSAAAMCYTSGTTGNPKGVVYSHRSIWLHTMAEQAASSVGMTEVDRILIIVPMFHAMAWGIPYAALMSGANLIMPDRFLQAAPIAAMIQAERPTFAGAVPTIWTDLLAYLDAHPDADISSMSEVVVGGSACPPALMQAFAKRGVQIIHAWGMTEMSPLGSVSRAPAGTEGEEMWAYRYTQGRVPAAVATRIVGPAGDVMPNDGEAVGEIEVRGPWITARYMGDDDPDKFNDGWLRTGDVGTLSANGFLTLTDRAKDVIKSGGEWISSVDLENALMGHPDVVEAAVIGIPDEKWQERPLATVVLREGATATPEDLRAHLSQSFAKWQLPDAWAFVDQVPRTSVGKFDKKVVRRDFADGAYDVRRVAD
jgi:fatty-acyl-CoA synthase